MAIESSSPPRGPVTATLNFELRPPPGQKAVNYTDDPPPGEPKRNLVSDPQPVLISDIREIGPESFTLDRDGFAFVPGNDGGEETGVETAQFVDDASIVANYYPEVEGVLLSHIPGATRVVIFDHTIRRADPSALRKAVHYVHIDQTPLSAANRVRRHLADTESEQEVARILDGGTRYRIVNVWRPLNKRPVESKPLAFCSSSSVADADIIPVEHRYPSGYTGQTAAIAWGPEQRWYYASGMLGSERLLLECFDSDGLREGSGVQGGRTPHTAFDDPRTREGAEGRESIEVRALVFGP